MEMAAFTISTSLPVTPGELYQTWLSSAGHAAMTGVPADITADTGAPFHVYSNYISGSNQELMPGRKIVQHWRTTEFRDTDPDSLLEITLEPATGGTLLTLHHSGLPDDGPDYASVWEMYYFLPMQLYFAGK